MKAAFLPKKEQVRNFSMVDVEKILNDIKTGKYKNLIDALPPYGTKEYTAAKIKLPSWSFAGTFKDSVTNDGFLESNNLFHIDIDGLEDVEYSRQWLIQSIPELVALWLSPSKHGLKGLVRVPNGLIKNDSDYKKAFEQLALYFVLYGFTIDPACKDVRRLCFVSSDADIYINLSANPYQFDMDKFNAVSTPSPKPKTSSNTSSSTSQKYIARAVSIIMSASSGGYHAARLAAGKLAGGFISAGMVSEADIVQALEKASDYISSQAGDDELTTARERKAIMDGVRVGLSSPCEPDRPRASGNSASFDYSAMPDIPPPDYWGNASVANSEASRSKTPETEKSTFKFVSGNDLISREYKPNWLVKGLFERNTMGLLFGNSASGKSLLVQDLSWCLANGFEFKGNKTAGVCKVAYICGEGFYGLMKRFKALQHYYGGNADNLIISEQPAAFMDIASADAVCNSIEEWGGCDLIVIDTFHRNMGAGDENSAKDFAQFLSNIDMFLKPFGATILIIHHSGHDAKERSRGSSAIRASMDFEYRMHKDEDTLITEFKNTKMKDYEPPAAMSFKFKPVDIGMIDDDGDDVLGVVLESTDEKGTGNKKPLDPTSQNVYSALFECLKIHGVNCPNQVKTYFNKSPENMPLQVVHIDNFRSFAYPFFDVEQQSKRSKLSRVIKKLEQHGKCMFYNDYLWVC